MKLKTKTLIALGITVAGLINVLYASFSSILLNSLAKAEQEGNFQTMQAVLSVFTQTKDNFSSRFIDWSSWDDTYNFVQDGNKRFIESNLVPGQLANLKLNLALFVKPSGQVVFGTGFNIKQKNFLPIPQELTKRLVSQDILVKHTNPQSNLTGFLIVDHKPMLVTSQPILTSEGKSPIRGTLIFGRYLDQEIIDKLSEITRLSLSLYPVNGANLPRDFQEVRSSLSLKDSVVVKPINQQTMAGYALLKDIYGKPALILRVNIPRPINQQTKLSQFYLIICLIIAGLGFGIVTLLLLEKLVLSRLSRLSNDVKIIGTTGDLSMRVGVSHHDELSTLAGTINWMLTTLEHSLKELQTEREKSERLLLNILPSPIADRLKEEEGGIADSFPEATVLFADIVGFTKLSEQTSPDKLVQLLNQIFSVFDKLAEEHKLEKIKTIGDAYMVAGGIPNLRSDHAEAIAEMALDMQEAIAQFNYENNQNFKIRIGINTGPVVAGVIGTKKFIYDLWGDTVNIASRMESHGIPGCSQVSETTYQKLSENYLFEQRGLIEIKGKGKMAAYLLKGKKIAEVFV